MRKISSSLLSVVIFLIFSASLSGCVFLLGAAAGGAGTALWVSGKLSVQESATYDKAVQATKKALASMNMAIKQETRTDKVTKITSEYTDGSTVWIDLRPVDANSSRIVIRVGMRGDKAASEKILEKIRKYL
jgi:hypothetical protein